MLIIFLNIRSYYKIINERPYCQYFENDIAIFVIKEFMYYILSNSYLLSIIYFYFI